MISFSTLVAFFALALAATMAMVAWRVVRDDRRRADARVAALADAIHDGPAREAAAFLGEHLAFVEPGPLSRRLRLAASAVGILAIGGAAIALGFGHSAPDAPQPASAASNPAGTNNALPPAARPNDAPAPLSLLSLTHERVGSRLTVSGLVREPDPSDRHLVAVVFAFDRNGTLLGSATGAVTPTVTRGEPARRGFAVTVADGDAVARYRVSFRAGDQVVPHVDERS